MKSILLFILSIASITIAHNSHNDHYYESYPQRYDDEGYKWRHKIERYIEDKEKEYNDEYEAKPIKLYVEKEDYKAEEQVTPANIEAKPTRDITKIPNNRKNNKVKSTRMEVPQPEATEIPEFEPVS